MEKISDNSCEDYIQPNRFKSLFNTKIIYCDTENVNAIIHTIKSNFVLVSHNSDGKIFSGGNYYPHANANNLPDNLIHWFGQNVCVYNDKISSIPIGLEDDIWFPHLEKKIKICNKLLEKKKHENLLYINHNINTNKKERKLPYDMFRDSNFSKCVDGKNGENFDDYLNSIYHSSFVISPEGNGTDTHRTWECLYLNTIPIEKRNINNSFYRDLPICFVDSWEEITKDFLIKEYNRITEQVWNLDKLKFSYWKKIIESKLYD